MSDPSALLTRLRATVRKFWANTEEQFKRVWEVLDKEGKSKFALACVEASKKICPKMDLLPEMDVEKFVEDPNHLSNMFWYYYTNDGIDRDKAMVADLIEAGVLTLASDDACAVRQMAILTCLSRAIDVYEAVWSRGTQRESKEEMQTMKTVLAAQALSVEKGMCVLCKKTNSGSLCARCQGVKYCGKDCQVAHWKTHKLYCGKSVPEEQDDAALLKKKLELAKKNARDRVDQGPTKVKTR